MPELASYELWFYGGILTMAFAGLLLIVQSIFFILKRSSISRKMDEEYGQPEKYNMKHKV